MDQRRARVGAILLGVLWILAGVVGTVPAMFSAMLFDAPGSTSNPWLWMFALSLLAFPVVAGGCGLAALVVTLWRGPGRAVAWLLLAPLLVILCGGTAILVIQYCYDGKFAA